MAVMTFTLDVNTCEYVMSRGKRNLADVIMARDLIKQRDESGLSGWTYSRHESSKAEDFLWAEIRSLRRT